MSLPKVEVESWITLVEINLTLVWIIREFVFTEWNLGKCDSSWNVKAVRLTSRTYVCVRTADPQITMPRIREVEVAPVVDRT